MSETAAGPSKVHAFLRMVADAPADESVASIIDVLQELLNMARECKLRSLVVVSVLAYGAVHV